MSSGLLHIRDAYYFELPKFIWGSNRETREDFPEYWIQLDPDYQDWEAERIAKALADAPAFAESEHPAPAELVAQYKAWRAEDKNFAKPFDRFLEEGESNEWFRTAIESDPQTEGVWQSIVADAESVEGYQATQPEWSDAKIAEYNQQLSGKVLIPQPFGTLKNNYEAESGFAISKFMIIIALVAGLMLWAFSSLARRISSGVPPRGKLWNLLEVFLMFIRDDVARPAIGKADADKFVPLLWTIFLFILGCNLMGMIPFVGAPTASFSVTLPLAGVIFLWGLWNGTKRFGVIGFWGNQVPTLDIPIFIKVIIWPLLFVIEVLGLFIKHAVLAVRLLANMVAGHLVLLAIMGIAVAAAGSGMTASWGIAAVISVLGSILISCLELFVAFLQAYVFTFLSAMFIGQAVHHH